MFHVKRAVVALAALPLIVGCASHEERLAYFGDRCVEYGFETGSEAHAACVQEEYLSHR